MSAAGTAFGDLALSGFICPQDSFPKFGKKALNRELPKRSALAIGASLGRGTELHGTLQVPPVLAALTLIMLGPIRQLREQRADNAFPGPGATKRAHGAFESRQGVGSRGHRRHLLAEPIQKLT